MSQPCEACEQAPEQRLEPCYEPSEHFRVCIGCHQRLLTRALRPVEWYNLAKRHGCHQFLLHDDFYDVDGNALQSEVEVERPGDFPAPTLADVRHLPSQLLDYSITRWWFEAELQTAWLAVPWPEILLVISERFAETSNSHIRSGLLEICALTLSGSGADFVRYAWGDYPDTVALPTLAQASAACLPFREGFSKVTTALAKADRSQRRNLLLFLGHFHSPEALDWIEQHIFPPITDVWGHLAAASRLDWPRVEDWLARGRP